MKGGGGGGKKRINAKRKREVTLFHRSGHEDREQSSNY